MSYGNIVKLKWIYFFKSLNFFAPILALFYLARGLTTFELLSLEVILTITIFVAEIPTGVLADRVKRKYAISASIFLYIIGNILTIYGHTYVVFAITEVLFGLALAFGDGAIEALVYDYLKTENKTKEMNKEWGSITAQYLFAGVLAALLGGYLAQDQSMQSFVLTFWLYSIGAGIALLISFFIVEPTHSKKIEHRSSIRIFKDAVQIIRENKSLRYIFFISIFTVPFPHIIKFLFQPYFNMAHVPAIFFGIAVAIAMLLGAALATYGYRIEQKWGISRTIFLMNIIPGIVYVLMSFIIDPVFSLLFYVAITAIANMRSPIFSQYINDHIESHNRATVLSVLSMVGAVYTVISQLIIGAIANISILAAFLTMGIIIIFGSLIFRIDEKHIAMNSKTAV